LKPETINSIQKTPSASFFGERGAGGKHQKTEIS